VWRIEEFLRALSLMDNRNQNLDTPLLKSIHPRRFQ